MPDTSKLSGRAVILVLCFSCCVSGCSRQFWRQQADADTYRAVSEKLTDERWQVPRMDLTPDPRSRFYDPYNPDCAPLPPDDPSAHLFMHCVNGKEGYKHWHRFGDAPTVENPAWLEPYQVLLCSANTVDGHSQVEIPTVTLRDAVDLSYIHSREYQSAIEDVYLSALALTLQRFRLGTRFGVGGGGSGLGGGRVAGDVNRNGDDTASIENGLGIRQLLPVGTELAVSVLNTITWNTSSGSGTATRLAWEVTQPFLRGGGRKVVLEALTQAERALLYEVRNLARFRQVLFTNVASDFLSILNQVQTIRNIENNIRLIEEQIEIQTARDNRTPRRVTEALKQWPDGAKIPESLRPFLIYDEQLQLLRWQGTLSDAQRDELLGISDDEDFQAAMQQLIRWKQMEVFSLSVAQLVTRLNSTQNRLENARRTLADLVDAYKIRLGLPTNVRMSVDTAPLAPFELIAPEIVMIETGLKGLARNQGPGLIQAAEDGVQNLEPDPDLLKKYAAELVEYRDRVRVEGIERVRQDFVPVRELLEATSRDPLAVEQGMRYFRSKEERDRVVNDVARDTRLFRINERDFETVSRLIDLVYNLIHEADSIDALFRRYDTNGDGFVVESELPAGWQDLPRAGELDEDEQLSQDIFISALRDSAIGLREELLQIIQSLQVVQVGLRVEVIAVNRFVLPGETEPPDIEEVVRIGLANRHDLMNARAAVMDSRRQLEVTANALMSVMSLSARGTLDPDGGTNDGVDLSLEFKGPIDQVEQRNAYRQAQVEYQRQRRAYMLLEDQVKRDIRASWRQLQVSEETLEIDRQTIRNAALQYDNTALEATGAGQTSSLNLLNALDSILNAQNSLVSDWNTYETNRLNIFRDMGIMEIDSTGIWEDTYYLSIQPTGGSAANPVPTYDPPASTELNPVRSDQLSDPADLPALEIP